jgi:hypothetical protein
MPDRITLKQVLGRASPVTEHRCRREES